MVGTIRIAAGRARGYTYIAVLALIAATGLGTASLVEVWSTAERRERERELLYVGEQFRRSIETFHRSSPGGVGQYPRSLADLLEDRRFIGGRRHLRKLYRDPISGSADWGLVRTPDGGIAGVYSRSERTPLKTQGFTGHMAPFAGARRYSEWEFVYRPPATPERRTQ
jgi:type II secretory pathway pseudopilin PulG